MAWPHRLAYLRIWRCCPGSRQAHTVEEAFVLLSHRDRKVGASGFCAVGGEEASWIQQPLLRLNIYKPCEGVYLLLLNFLIPGRDVSVPPSLERRKNWLINVCKTPKREALCKCHGWLLLLSLSKENQTMSSLWAQLDLWGETENSTLRAQELLLDGLCKHSRPVFAACPELRLPYCQFFLL